MSEQTSLFGSSVVDLTQVLENGMPAGAGLPSPEFTDLARVETDGYGMSKFVFSVNHVGTHIDAPTHIVRGKTLTEFAPQKFVGPAVVLNFADHARGLLTRADIEPYLEHIQPGDMVLIHSGGDRYWKTPEYLHGWCYPDVEATRALIERQISIIGFDGPSADSMDPLEITQHQLLLEREILIIENLTNLQQLPERVLLVVGAIPVQHANGAPARVFALF